MVVGAICFIAGTLVGAIIAALVIKNNPDKAKQAAARADEIKKKVG